MALTSGQILALIGITYVVIYAIVDNITTTVKYCAIIRFKIKETECDAITKEDTGYHLK